MFCTVSVTRGSRSRLRGHARPSAVFSVGRPCCTSTHTGTPWIVPSRRNVATLQKFFALSSSSLRPSIVAAIDQAPFSRCVQCTSPIGRIGRPLKAPVPLAGRERRLIPGYPRAPVQRRNRVERRKFPVVELEADLPLAAPGTAQRIAPAIQRIGERHFGVALALDAHRGAGLARVGADVASVDE